MQYTHCAKVYTYTQTHICWASLSLTLTLWHPLFSFKMSLSEADGWDMWVFVCPRVFILSSTEAIIKDLILFGFGNQRVELEQASPY